MSTVWTVYQLINAPPHHIPSLVCLILGWCQCINHWRTDCSPPAPRVEVAATNWYGEI